MGLYVNPGNEAFRQAAADELYIDKTNLISQIDQKLNKSRTKHLCVSRPRRFGKFMAADMLMAYYSKGCKSEELFAQKKTAQEPSYKQHLNQYHVIRLDIQQFPLLISQQHSPVKIYQDLF